MAEAPRRFAELIAKITDSIGDEEVASPLGKRLATEFPTEGAIFREFEAFCHQGCDEGWLCAREADGIRFGRPLKSGD